MFIRYEGSRKLTRLNYFLSPLHHTGIFLSMLTRTYGNLVGRRNMGMIHHRQRIYISCMGALYSRMRSLKVEFLAKSNLRHL